MAFVIKHNDVRFSFFTSFVFRALIVFFLEFQNASFMKYGSCDDEKMYQFISFELWKFDKNYALRK